MKDFLIQMQSSEWFVFILLVPVSFKVELTSSFK